MANAFSRTLRSLERERTIRTTTWLVLALLLLAGWTAWLLLGRVRVYEVSESGRLEVRSAPHPVSAVMDGRVVLTRLELNRAVEAGEVLVELDAGAARLELKEATARAADLAAQLNALREELALEQDALRAHRAARQTAVEEALARAREARVRAGLARAEARRVEQLSDAGGVADMERDRAVAEAEATGATAQALAVAVSRLRGDSRLEESDRGKRVAELRGRIVALEGQRAVEASRAERLAYLVEERRVRAPVAGRIGEAAELEAGAVVRVGDRLGSVVPNGELRASALFAASKLGRIRRGQPAQIRLAGFPWTEYGTLRARVVDVARESREGRFRVDLQLEPDARSAIPMEHGLPGVVEVEVEHISPLALVLRASGRALTAGGKPRRLTVRQ